MKLFRLFFLIFLCSSYTSCSLVVHLIVEIINSTNEETTSPNNSDSNFSNESLNEEFNNNQLEWKIDSSLDCSFKMENGTYIIANTNSSPKNSITISTPSNLIFLTHLPDKYLISSKIIEQAKTGKDDVFSGIILGSHDLQYNFYFYKKGKIEVSKYDTYTKLYTLVFENINDSIGMQDSLEFSIYFYEYEYDLNVNGNIIYHGEIENENWTSLGLVTSKYSITKFDYLKIFGM